MLKFNSPLEAFIHWEQNAPDNIFLRQPFNRIIKEYSYGDAGNEIRRIAKGLLSLNMEPRSKVGLLSKNCAHWIMADLAIMMADHISVPIYPTLNGDSIRQILEHSDSKAIFVGKLDNYETQKPGIPDIHKIGIKAYDIEESLSWEDLVSKHNPIEEVRTQEKDDMLTFIYTSGTTGAPKGVMHTVGNVAQVANNAIDILPIKEHPRFFSFLPLSHVAERVAIELHGIHKGAIFNFPESLDTFAEDLEAARPHLFFAVPRIYAKFQEKILEKMPQEKLSKLLKIPILGGIIKKKIVKKLGLYDASYIASGAAPIAASLQEWFSKLGIIIHQDYGMTEDCILSHYNLVGSNKIGTVGRAVPGVTRKLSPEGEICVKSDALMKGYYKEPELTAEMFDEEGFLKTGDIGEYDHDGFLTITGRVKDQFKPTTDADRLRNERPVPWVPVATAPAIAWRSMSP